ncbi:hypothetical protein SESBI_16134 [Sesbania bispinosa]|nr:hypothetical protein SESBI_16134 [Sesbania bispinosa]
MEKCFVAPSPWLHTYNHDTSHNASVKEPRHVQPYTNHDTTVRGGHHRPRIHPPRYPNPLQNDALSFSSRVLILHNLQYVAINHGCHLSSITLLHHPHEPRTQKLSEKLNPKPGGAQQ